ncbi:MULTISPECIES: virulence factor BrkB family protein [Vibrio]|uniref:virulence factor BrkB family protein n=1 Tax=Vibrio TaxID=662 RepID=UPI001482CCB5|nr:MULTISPECIES: virulence factor BrkB family protein [Vibrio]MDQ2165840.1 virulence factor BrkB family protein [Vibrio anguillarum]NNN97244.1 virulence factor BrkB family protein [Vibrio sp. B4-6]
MKIKKLGKQCLLFTRYLLSRMGHDRVNVNAGYLAYITLLSIVPMLTVLLSILSSFSIFANVGMVIQDFVITHFVPAAGDVVREALLEFIANTGKMTAVGGVFLFVAALMLISNIDKNLNYIWRVKDKRRMVLSFSMYWMVLTLGPILVGASIAATSYITSLKIIDSEALSGAYNLLLRWLPFILSFSAFVGLYLLVPNKKVHLSHALVGAMVAAILFEFSKKGFAAYITQFPSYQLIYGALAAIPILFVWVYLCWMIVLVGAEVTATLGEKEHWSNEQEMLNSLPISEQMIKGNQSDSVDPESE